ncbi:MAG: histidinol-phosphatase [Rhodothermales bacterium]
MNRLFLLVVAILVLTGCQTAPEARWYKGNLHTHTFWSDGDDFPEQVTQWYVDNGYAFLAISDHNTIADGERWLSIPESHSRFDTFQRYLADSPEGWAEWEQGTDTVRVRLKTWEEYSARFQDEGRFLMMRAEEVSDGFDGKPIHVNATNIVEYVEPQHGGSVVEVMQNNVNAILSQGERLQRRVMPHINHPNFIWAIRADELAMVDGERFFEVFNGHPLVYNDGDSLRHGMEKTWDVVNTIRLRDGRPLMFGIGTDDSHHYQELAPGRANVGRGWVMVQAEALNPDAILKAMDEGSFYASSGVTLSDVAYDGESYRVVVEPEEGVSYTVEFYGTDADHDPAPVAVNDPETGELITYRYSDDVGRLLQRTTGIEASFAVVPDLLYVRARVVSDKVMDNPVVEGEQEKAWTQPVLPGIPR